MVASSIFLNFFSKRCSHAAFCAWGRLERSVSRSFGRPSIAASSTASRMRPTAFPDTPECVCDVGAAYGQIGARKGSFRAKKLVEDFESQRRFFGLGPAEFQGRKLRMLQREQVAHERCVAAFEDSKRRDAAGRGRDVFIVTNYDSADFFAKAARGFQFFQERLGAQSAFFRVVFRVVRAKRGGRLCPVAKQGGKTQGRARQACGLKRAPCARDVGAFPEIQRLRCHGACSLDYDVEDIVVFQKDGGSTGRAQNEHSSAKTRSFDKDFKSGAFSRIAFFVRCSMENPSFAAKRRPLMIRRGSSARRSKGLPTAQRRRFRMSSSPPKGSRRPREGWKAMALMRKSRRERSSSMVSANTTVSGCRASLYIPSTR